MDCNALKLHIENLLSSKDKISIKLCIADLNKYIEKLQSSKDDIIFKIKNNNGNYLMSELRVELTALNKTMLMLFDYITELYSKLL
jgi:hypothetical protein